MIDPRREFANVVTDAIRTLRGANVSCTYDTARFALEIRDGEKDVFVLFLERAFAEHQSLPEQERARALTKWIARPPTSGASLDEVRARLLPRLRPRSSFTQAGLEAQRLGAGSFIATPHRVVGDEYACAICIDSEDMVADVSREDLHRMGIAFDEALDIAMENLRARTEASTFVEHAPGVYVSQWHDSYDATRILLPEVIRPLPVKGDPLVFAFSPNALVVTGADDLQGIAGVLQEAEPAMTDPRFSGYFPLRLRSEGWAPFAPAIGEHPLGLELWRLRAIGRSAAYERQRESLNELYSSTAFVNRFTAMAGANNATMIHAAWANDGVPVLLPEVETLLLGLTPTKICMVTFAEARRVLGAKMQAMPDIYPPRYRVDSFPGEEDIAAMQPKWLGG